MSWSQIAAKFVIYMLLASRCPVASQSSKDIQNVEELTVDPCLVQNILELIDNKLLSSNQFNTECLHSVEMQVY